MLSFIKYPAAKRNTAVSTFYCLFQQSLKTTQIAKLHSKSCFHHGFQLRLWSTVSFRKQPLLTPQFDSSCWTCSHNVIQCYCTRAKQIEQLNNTEVSMTADLSEPIINKKITDSSNSIDVNKMEFAYEDVDNDEPIDIRALIELEIELLRQEGHNVPDHISSFHWEELLSRNSRSARKKYLKFLFLTQMKIENEKKKKELKRREREKELENVNMSSDRYVGEDGHIQYGLWCNTIFLRILDTTVNQFHHGRVFNALMYGQPLVFDLGYDAHMNSKERQRCANQLMNSFASNRLHDDPFYLYFCNASRDADTVKRLERFIPTMYNPEFPLTVTHDSYLDCFPKEKLVYLTPHCQEELTKFDHNAIYIIGGMVDLGDSEPLSLAKAKREGIKMKKFPLERYLDWGLGGKSLTLNQTVDIMLDLKHTDNWSYSLRHIPRRKLRSADESQGRLENYIRKSLRKSQNAKEKFNKHSTNIRVKSFYDE